MKLMVNDGPTVSPRHQRLEAGTLWRHLKTGNIYVIVGPCQMEATWTPGVLYRRADDRDALSPMGPIARDRSEFCDGRFQPVEIDT